MHDMAALIVRELKARVDECQRRGEVTHARLWQALAPRICMGLPKGCGVAEAPRTVDAFLLHFGFHTSVDEEPVGTLCAAPTGVSPLFCAALSGNAVIMRALLLEENACVKTRILRNFRKFALMKGVGVLGALNFAPSNHVEMLKLLCQAGARIDTAVEAGFAPITGAIYMQNLSAVRAYLHLGANVGRRDGPVQGTLLTNAAFMGSIEAVVALVEAKADPFAKTLTGTAALQNACLNPESTPAMLELLVGDAANINVQGLPTHPIISLVLKVFERMVSWRLLKSNYALGLAHDRGSTALHLAVREGAVPLACWLLTHGARPSLEVINKLGYTPVRLALGHPEMLAALTTLNASQIAVQPRDNERWSFQVALSDVQEQARSSPLDAPQLVDAIEGSGQKRASESGVRASKRESRNDSLSNGASRNYSLGNEACVMRRWRHRSGSTFIRYTTFDSQDVPALGPVARWATSLLASVPLGFAFALGFPLGCLAPAGSTGSTVAENIAFNICIYASLAPVVHCFGLHDMQLTGKLSWWALHALNWFIPLVLVRSAVEAMSGFHSSLSVVYSMLSFVYYGLAALLSSPSLILLYDGDPRWYLPTIRRLKKALQARALRTELLSLAALFSAVYLYIAYLPFDAVLFHTLDSYWARKLGRPLVAVVFRTMMMMLAYRAIESSASPSLRMYGLLTVHVVKFSVWIRLMSTAADHEEIVISIAIDAVTFVVESLHLWHTVSKAQLSLTGRQRSETSLQMVAPRLTRVGLAGSSRGGHTSHARLVCKHAPEALC
jgi:ankyrin repeat protein